MNEPLTDEEFEKLKKDWESTGVFSFDEIICLIATVDRDTHVIAKIAKENAKLNFQLDAALKRIEEME